MRQFASQTALLRLRTRQGGLQLGDPGLRRGQLLAQFGIDRHQCEVPAGALATELGNPRVANVILLGALSQFVEIPAEAWLNAIAERVPPKFRELNRRAFELGRGAGERNPSNT